MVAMFLLLVTLTYTVPDSTAGWSGSGDSIQIVCGERGVALRDYGPSGLWDTRLYAYSLRGGGYQLIRSHDARGLEGLRDTFQVDPGPGSWYYVTSRADSGRKESCASNSLYIAGTVTAVEDQKRPTHDPVIWSGFFDVSGRKIEQMASNGIYFYKEIHQSGRTTNRRALRLLGKTIWLK